MSRLIKSINAKQPESIEKKIKLRTIQTFSAEKKTEIDDLNQQKIDGIYKDEELIKREKEDLDRMKEELQLAKEQWTIEINEQQNKIESDAELRFQQAAEAGFNEGYENGAIEGEKQYTSLVELAKQTVRVSQEDYYKKLDESEPLLLELAFTVANKIVAQTLHHDNKAWKSLVCEALAEVREHEEVKIYVHPSWYELTIQHKQELKDIALHTRELMIFPDEQLSENGCILETPFGQIDASVDSQLREIKRVLFEKLKEGAIDEHSRTNTTS